MKISYVAMNRRDDMAMILGATVFIRGGPNK
jgi:hypothetical protein